MGYPKPDGDRWTGLGTAPLPLAEVHAFLHDERAGGVAVFVGVTRRWTDGVETDRIWYEAYEPMAEAELRRLLAEAERRWPVQKGVALHRLGAVEAGEASVVVGASCPHRAEAFEACRWLIDTLKAEVPIWKQERHGASGRAAWVRPTGA